MILKKKCLTSVGIAEQPFCREIICVIQLTTRSHTKFSSIIFLMYLAELKSSRPLIIFFPRYVYCIIIISEVST